MLDDTKLGTSNSRGHTRSLRAPPLSLERLLVRLGGNFTFMLGDRSWKWPT